MKIGFTLNGAPVCVEAPGTVSLLTLLRDYCRLTGTKRGCDIGECGACTVLLDDRAVTSCMVMAGQVQGRRVVTIEGLTGHDGALSPPTAGVCGLLCCTVRLLHARHDHECHSAAARGPASLPGEDTAGDLGQSVPVHRLRRYCGRH